MDEILRGGSTEYGWIVGRNHMRDIQDITLSAISTAFLFINMFVIDFLFFREGVFNQFNAYFFGSTFIFGVFYIRLRMIGSNVEGVQKQLEDETITLRSTAESLKDEITTIRSYVVIGIENPALDVLKHEISSMHAELKGELANIVDALTKR